MPATKIKTGDIADGNVYLADLNSEVTAKLIPAGVILMWSGLIANIPTGWVLCDGTNSTPDLRNSFIKSVGASENPGGIGGASTHSHTVASHAHSSPAVTDPQHNHGITDPQHTHGLTWPSSPKIIGAGTAYAAPTLNNASTGVTTNNAATGISLAANTGNAAPGTDSQNHEPTYYKLAFIMKL